MTTISVFSHREGVNPQQAAQPAAGLPPHSFDRLLGFAPLTGPLLLGLPQALHAQGFSSLCCGVGVHHPHTLLGLRLWRDCEETPQAALYELEKILRMLLRQSLLAADIFLSIDPVSSIDTAWLFSSAMTQELPAALLQRARLPMKQMSAALDANLPSSISAATLLPALLDVMTCSALSHHALYTRHLPTLLELPEHAQLREVCDWSEDTLEARALEVASSLRALFDALVSQRPFLNSLPPQPLGYDALHDFLVEQRMEASIRS